MRYLLAALCGGLVVGAGVVAYVYYLGYKAWEQS